MNERFSRLTATCWKVLSSNIVGRQGARAVLIAVAVAAPALLSTQASATSLGGHCSNWMTFSVASKGTRTNDSRGTSAACRALRASGDFKTHFERRSGVCLICAKEDWTSNTPSPVKPKVTLPPLPPGIHVLNGPVQENSCATNYPSWGYDAHRITISATSGNCPKPYITNGYDRSFSPGRRICAYCGDSYDKGLKYGCCQK